MLCTCTHCLPISPSLLYAYCLPISIPQTVCIYQLMYCPSSIAFCGYNIWYSIQEQVYCLLHQTIKLCLVCSYNILPVVTCISLLQAFRLQEQPSTTNELYLLVFGLIWGVNFGQSPAGSYHKAQTWDGTHSAWPAPALCCASASCPVIWPKPIDCVFGVCINSLFTSCGVNVS